MRTEPHFQDVTKKRDEGAAAITTRARQTKCVRVNLSSVCVDGYLVRVLVDPIYPLVRTSVATAMRDRTVGFAAAGSEAESQHHQEDRGVTHVFL
jgi:hypothetical protein